MAADRSDAGMGIQAAQAYLREPKHAAVVPVSKHEVAVDVRTKEKPRRGGA